MEVPLWAVLTSIGGAVVLLICLVTVCAIRCFRPQNSVGPEWFVSKQGKEIHVKGLFRDGGDGDTNQDGNAWLRVKETQAVGL